MNDYSCKSYFGWNCSSSPGPGLTPLSLHFKSWGIVSILQPSVTKTRCFSARNLSLSLEQALKNWFACLFVCFNQGECDAPECKCKLHFLSFMLIQQSIKEMTKTLRQQTTLVSLWFQSLTPTLEDH